MTRRSRSLLALSILLAMFVAHQDFWLWEDSRRLFSLPVGLAYHVGYCLLTAVVMALLLRLVGPRDPESP